MGIGEKCEPRFVEPLKASKKETPNKNRSEGNKRKGKSKLFKSGAKFQEKGDVAT
jgi:hypothetical protein